MQNGYFIRLWGLHKNWLYTQRSGLHIKWKRPRDRVSASDFGSRGRGFESHWRRDSSPTWTALHCPEPFMFILPSSRNDWNTVKRDVKPYLIHTYIYIHIKMVTYTAAAFHAKKAVEHKYKWLYTRQPSIHAEKAIYTTAGRTFNTGCRVYIILNI